jgi:hypothetical protein
VSRAIHPKVPLGLFSWVARVTPFAPKPRLVHIKNRQQKQIGKSVSKGVFSAAVVHPGLGIKLK